MQNNYLKKTSILILSLFLFACSFHQTKDKQEKEYNCDNCIKSKDSNQFLFYENHDFLKFYEGEINEDGLYDGKGSFFFSDGSYLHGFSSRGLIYAGDYFLHKNGFLYTLSFENELIDPYFLKEYQFKNKVIYKKGYSDFSYNGNFKNLTPYGSGVLYYNDLIFDGDFNNESFFGTIENNFQNKKFKSENNNNSVLFEFIDDKKNKKNIIQGFVNKKKLKGHETIYISNKEIISYEGEWELNFNPFYFEDFNFQKFKKNGLFKIENPDTNITSIGNFTDDKKNGYFEKFINSKLASFDYYKDNELLYSIPFFLEKNISLINPKKCQFNFPSTINIWQPIEFLSCDNNIYNINFIDKENKDFLLNMTYDFNKNKLIELTVYHNDYKYIFSDFKINAELGIPQYYLEGDATIYQFINHKYKLINKSYINLSSKK